MARPGMKWVTRECICTYGYLKTRVPTGNGYYVSGYKDCTLPGCRHGYVTKEVPMTLWDRIKEWWHG